MSNDSKVAGKIKDQIKNFCNDLTFRLKEPQRKFVRHMIYGIQARKDVKLSNISRALEEDIALIKTENRLSRNLKGKDLVFSISNEILKRGAKRVDKETVLALDLSDIRKEYGKKMDYLGGVWDGSRGEVGNGWWLLGIIGADIRGEEIIPLHQEIFSQNEKGLVSENHKIISAIESTSKHIGRKGI